ncbi:thioredoxin family protein [Neorhodopirellula pilleata]|uniref:Thioredoxin n=1 Tax=Neorhodopirellula pilleata TaxID=2714738 RepID=A0A5C5ZHU5_9BACT|nr:thioredoxin domain-containing protein [Neorhodopirellula pilleata]TWT86123.1 Thioredoxin [Neorhodopirellula pilleata]
MQRTLEITDANFEAVVVSSPLPTVVEFYAAWCGPSQATQPETVHHASQNHDCRIGRLDVDKNPLCVKRLGISSIPAVRFFSGADSTGELNTL